MIGSKKCIDDEDSVYSNSQSYWLQALQECGLEPARMHSTYKHIDHFWSKIGSIKNDHGIAQYRQLFALVRSVLSLSHGNAYPEQGFSINK